MHYEASKRCCNKIKLISLSFVNVSKLITKDFDCKIYLVILTFANKNVLRKFFNRENPASSAANQLLRDSSKQMLAI
jgi:hypothetical protein